MSRLSKFRHQVVIVVNLFLASALAQAQLTPSADDLWDVSNGNSVTASSALLGGSSARNMLGAQDGGPEAVNTLFTDANLAGFVHFVEWQAPSENTVRSMVLNAAHDGTPFDANERGFSRYTLYAKNPQTNAFDIELVDYSTANPYSNGPQPENGVANFNQAGNQIQLCVNFPPVRAREFRAEFVQFGDRTGLARGPRISELDGYSESPCPTFQINPGVNDAWFNGATAGQGFFIIVFPDVGIVFLAWFTYDTELPPEDVVASLGAAEHRWVTAQGPYEGNTATLDVFLTEGGVFDMAEPEPVTGEDPIGTITIVWHDCENATLTYDIDPPGVMGEIPIKRIVPDNVSLCEALNE